MMIAVVQVALVASAMTLVSGNAASEVEMSDSNQTGNVFLSQLVPMKMTVADSCCPSGQCSGTCELIVYSFDCNGICQQPTNYGTLSILIAGFGGLIGGLCRCCRRQCSDEAGGQEPLVRAQMPPAPQLMPPPSQAVYYAEEDVTLYEVSITHNKDHMGIEFDWNNFNISVVTPGGLASQHHIAPGDKILEVNGSTLLTKEQYFGAMEQSTEVKLKLCRAGKAVVTA